MVVAYLGLGSNEGDRKTNLKRAVVLLDQFTKIDVKAISSLYEGEAIGVSGQGDFVNAVVKIETQLEPKTLLEKIKSIETKMGRKPSTHNRPRPIDIDILLYGDVIFESFDLNIPHTRLLKRRFVMEPLVEIEPKIVDPVSMKPIKEYLELVKDQRLKRISDSIHMWVKKTGVKHV